MRHSLRVLDRPVEPGDDSFGCMPRTRVPDRIDPRFSRNQSDKRKFSCSTGPRREFRVPRFHFRKAKAASFIRAGVAKETVMRAEEAASWDNQDECFEIKGIDDPKAYGFDGARAHMAEEYISRLRRSETGLDHPVACAHCPRSAQQPPWREDQRRVSTRNPVNGTPRRQGTG